MICDVHKHLQVSCVFICELAFYICPTLLFWDHSEICSSRRRSMLRKTIGEKKLSKNLRRKKPSIGKFPFVMVPSTMHVFKIGKMRLSENLSNIKKHPKNPRRKKLLSITTPFARLRVTMNSLRWMFLLVFIYLTFGIIILFVQQGNETIRDIVVYSIMGFVTFFMGYFGWLIARTVQEVVSAKKPKDNF